MPAQIIGLAAGLGIGALLGVLLSTIVLVWYKKSRPYRLILEGMTHNNELCLISIRHLFIDDTTFEATPLRECLPRFGITAPVSNVRDLCADVDGIALANVLNVLGQAGKSENIRIIRTSEDRGEWNGHLIVIGGESQQSCEFCSSMQPIFYRLRSTDIYDTTEDCGILQEPGFVYGVILKARNPKRAGRPGVALLIGGLGPGGTEAASYYLREHLDELGREFGSNCFGIVVRASVAAGVQSAERLLQYDRVEKELYEW
jgi:hypothetical protein